MARDLSPEQKQQVLDERNQTETTIDNGATHGQIQYLARIHHATRDEKYADAARRGIQYLLDAQYASGGWPMIYPLRARLLLAHHF